MVSNVPYACGCGLLSGNAKVAALIVVSPGARHRIAADLAVNDVVDGSTAITFGIEFHGNGSCLRLE
jgi:hypothetical protein